MSSGSSRNPDSARSSLEDFWARAEVKALRERAEAAERQGQHEAARAAWDELVARYPDELGGWSARGRFLERRGEPEAALASFRRSTAIRPNYPDHYNAATMLLHLGRDEEALAELEASLEQNDGYAEAWCNRGIALSRLQRPEEARKSFERAEAVDDTLANAFRCHAVLLASLGEPAGAVPLRARVAELEPKSSTAQLAYAHALGAAHDDRYVHWEPGGVEEQIVAAVERGLALPCNEQQRRWAWTEKVWRLQRIAHGRQASRRAGVPSVDDAGAIARFAAAAEEGARLFPDDAWFTEQLEDARELSG